MKCNDNIGSLVSTTTTTTADNICRIKPNQSTYVSNNLFSKSKINLNKYNPNLILKKQNLSHQLNAINFLQEYLDNENSDVLIDLLYEIAEEINLDHYLNSTMNNNHFHLTPIFNSNIQLSNNKEKKNKKEKFVEKEKKDNETANKKREKSKEKAKKIEDTTSTTDSDVVVNSPSLINPTHINLITSESIDFPSLSIPVPQQSNIVHLTQVQQQLQSLSQMAHDGDEILITLNINALTQKQQINHNNIQSSFQNNPYPSQPTIMPRNIEIVAKGFARVQNEHLQLPPSNPYPQKQQSMMPSHNQLPFSPRYPMPCHSNSGPPQIPIGPPIQPIFAPPNIMMSGGFIPSPNSTDYTLDMRNNYDNAHSRSHKTTGKCDYLCESSLYQPDFRGRPSPGIMINPYFSNSHSPINFSAKRSSKHKTKFSSSKTKSKF